MVSRRFDGWKKARMSVSALIKMEQNHVGANGLVSTFSLKIPSERIFTAVIIIANRPVHFSFVKIIYQILLVCDP